MRFSKRFYIAQYCVLAMIEKWKTPINNGGVSAALLTDPSKAFDSIPHDLIIAKLAAYGSNTNALKPIHNYLSNRKQRVLGPLLFNIHLRDVLFPRKH